MRRGTLVLIIFILIAGGIIGASFFIQNQAPAEFTIAVNPLLEDWLRAEVTRFNESEPIINNTKRIQLNVISTNDIDVWRDNPNWTQENHPIAWLPSTTASVNYLPINLPFQIATSSVARTVLVWGGFESRTNIITENGTQPLDWGTIQAAAEVASWHALGGETNWQFIKLAFSLPRNSMNGFAVLLSGVGQFHETATPQRSMFTDSAFRVWMEPIIDSVNFQTLGVNPARTMASRGTSVAEIALLPESQWLTNLNELDNNEAIVFAYPAYQFVFDFPIAQWASSPLTSDEQAAVNQFSNWLTGNAAQSRLTQFGLRPVSGEPTATDTLFANAQTYGIQLLPNYGIQVQAPTRSEAESLMEQFN